MKLSSLAMLQNIINLACVTFVVPLFTPAYLITVILKKNAICFH